MTRDRDATHPNWDAESPEGKTKQQARGWSGHAAERFFEYHGVPMNRSSWVKAVAEIREGRALLLGAMMKQTGDARAYRVEICGIECNVIYRHDMIVTVLPPTGSLSLRTFTWRKRDLASFRTYEKNPKFRRGKRMPRKTCWRPGDEGWPDTEDEVGDE